MSDRVAIAFRILDYKRDMVTPELREKAISVLSLALTPNANPELPSALDLNALDSGFDWRLCIAIAKTMDAGNARKVAENLKVADIIEWTEPELRRLPRANIGDSTIARTKGILAMAGLSLGGSR